MSIIRVQKNSNYSVISNVHINDGRLSWKATAILTYLLSKPNDWTVYVNQLAKAKKDGIKAVYSGIRELKEFGYIEHKFIHGEDGKIIHGEYIVHEEPMAVETTVKPESLPYTQKGDTVKSNADNGTLLNIDIELNIDDDKTGPPPSPVPAPQENEESPSSSFSEIQLLSIISTLMAFVPEQHRKPSIEKAIEKGLKANGEDYVRAAIAYAVANSNGGTWQKFKAYLGKTIEHGWADGWEPDKAPDQSAIKKEFASMPDEVLRMLSDAGNMFAIAELKTRVE
jgi:hypothetical protein